MTKGKAEPTGRVLIIGTFLSNTRRSHSVCEDLAAGLTLSGWQVTTASRSPNRVGRIVDMLRATWRARRHFDVAQVDVYSGSAFIWAEAVCKLLSMLGKPFVLTLHGGNLPTFARRWPRRVGRLLESAAAVTTPSRYLLEEMAPYRSDMRLLHNPIALDAYPFTCRARVAPRMVWLRAFHEIYNPWLAIRAVARLRPSTPDIHLEMVGPDKDGTLASVKRLALQLGVDDAVEFCGGIPKSDVPAVLQRADLFMNTTNVDNTPVSVIEALACGLPVISTNVGGIPHLLRDGWNALLIPPDDVAAAASAVRRLLEEPDLAAHLSRNGRRTAESMSFDAVIPAWSELLQNVSGVREPLSPDALRV